MAADRARSGSSHGHALLTRWLPLASPTWSNPSSQSRSRPSSRSGVCARARTACPSFTPWFASGLPLSLLIFDGADDTEGNRVSRVRDEGALNNASARLEVDPPMLSDALCTRRIYLPTGDAYVKPLDEAQAADGRSALQKAVYGRLFDAIVERLNSLISVESAEGALHDLHKFNTAQQIRPVSTSYLSQVGSRSRKHSLASSTYSASSRSSRTHSSNCASTSRTKCYNSSSMPTSFVSSRKSMTSHPVSLLFLHHIFFPFRYDTEGVPWQHIEYQDNEPVLELIRGKRNGILTLLDEECRLQQGSPQSFTTKLTNSHGKSDLFSIPKMARGGRDTAPSFCVSHYAGKIEYDTALFLQKNTDPLHPELVEMMQTSASGCVIAPLPAPRGAASLSSRLYKPQLSPHLM